MEEPLRSPSVRHTRPRTFQARASQIFKKVTNFRNRAASRNDGDTDPYKRQVRSMDVSQKPYMSQPSLGLERPSPNSMDDSSRSDLPENGFSRHSKRKHNPPSATRSVDLRPRTPLSAGADPQSDTFVLRLSKPIGLPDIVVSNAPTTIKKRRSKKSNIMERPRRSRDGDRPRTAPRPETPSAPPPTPQASSMASTSSGSRPPIPQLSSLPPSLTRFNTGSVRLTPSIVCRQPMPIQNLPTLPPPTIQREPVRVRSRQRLRTVPALTMDGEDEDVSHESSAPDSDDDDDGDMDPEMEQDDGMGSEDEDTRSLSSNSSRGSRGRRLQGSSALPHVDTSRLDLSFLTSPLKIPAVSTSTLSFEAVDTPIAKVPADHRSFDYFAFKDSEYTPPTRTPRPADAKPRFSGAWGQPTTPQTILVPSPELSPRPSMYRHASKSMVNVAQRNTKHVSPTLEEPTGSSGKGKGKAREVPQEESAPSHKRGSIPSYDALSPSLQRRRSMPTFNGNSEPPPYPSFAPRNNRFTHLPEDEGKESLPAYSNSIHITAIMPRKLEFSSPGIQAKDRKWRRVLCVLEGTAFRVYKCPAGAAGVGVIGEWWEKKVGVGDVTVTEEPVKREIVKAKWDAETTDPPNAVVTPPPSGPSEGVPLSPSITASSGTSGTGSNRSRLNLGRNFLKASNSAANLLRPTTPRARSHSRTQSDAPRTRSRPSTPHPPSTSRSSADPVIPPGSSRSSFTTNTNPSTRPSHFTNSSRTSCPYPADLPVPDKRDLMRAYTLQHAESGLGNDYLKRKNVIRVRMEGEQFLLQAQDVNAVVEWIEGLHAATNVALDLDERVMPKGPIFPRRRRRRRRQETQTANAATPTENRATTTR